MQIMITGRNDAAKCVWCEKERETIQVTFSDGFLNNASICYRCLQQAFRVRSRQDSNPTKEPTDSAEKATPKAAGGASTGT